MADARASLKERLEHRLARVLFGLPPGWQVRLSGTAPIVRDALTLAPELQLMLALRRRLGAKALSEGAPERARRRYRRDTLQHSGPVVPVGAVRDLVIAGPAGPLRLRHYAPPDVSLPAPMLVFLHGGGFVLGDLDTHDPVCRTLCRHARVHVLAVDYRLAPEAPFPAGLDDARAAFAWAHAHAGELGADPLRVAVGGDSAGGNLSAVVARAASAAGGAVPCAQLLLYPAVDRSVDRASMALFADDFVLTRRDIDAFQQLYVGHPGIAAADPLHSPLLAPDLTGSPPALVVTAGFDPLRDEGEAYAAALRTAGATVVLRRFDALVHGFANMVGVSPASRGALIEVATRFRTLLDTAGAAP